ncbi:MAG: 50S ribosomal protein L13 [Candidatus Nanohaloarchaea archaeon]|nr:50S ribosomal protein L13 [Candidatus Nanohaloarchaea archaeon]
MAETVDAEGKILGRLASYAAEKVKDGEELNIVNSEKAVISGTPEQVFGDYRERRERGSKEKGPRYPKAPERILKRTVKGMLPDNADGREAFKRLKTYRGNPEGRETEELDVKTVEELEGRKHVTLEQVSEKI